MEKINDFLGCGDKDISQIEIKNTSEELLKLTSKAVQNLEGKIIII